MELQQRTELNIGTPRDSRPSQKSGAGASQRADQRNDDSARGSSFNEQVKKQLEQDKARQARENSSDNQKDRKTSTDTEQASSSTSEGYAKTADAPRGETAAAQDHATTGEQTDSEQAISEFAGQLQTGLLEGETDTETGIVTTAESGALLSSELPQGGKALPSQAEAISAASLTTGKAEAEAIPVAADGDKLNARSLQQKAAAADQAILQSLNQQASRVNREGAIDVPATDAKGLKLNLFDDLLTARNAQFKTLNELPAAEMIGKASRLQQVPLSTALASSLPASANVNAAPASALDAAGFNLNAPLANGFGAAALSTSIMTPLQHPGWSQQMTDQVSLMLKGGFQQADIKLNPAHLGPMEIKLSMNDDKASIHFVSQHAPVRDAIDSALPRLREMLEQQGVSLGDVDVSAQSGQQQSDAEPQQSASASTMQQSEGTDTGLQGSDELPMTRIDLSVDSGINLYA